MKRKWGITEKVFLILVIAVFAVFGGRKFFSIYNTVKSDETSQSLSTDEAVTVVQEERNKSRKRTVIRSMCGSIRMKYWTQRF